jgi:hypothetical protein
MILNDLTMVVCEPSFEVELSVRIIPTIERMTMSMSKVFQESLKYRRP